LAVLQDVDLHLLSAQNTNPLPPDYLPSQSIEKHPLKELARRLNPRHRYEVFDYPGLSKENSRENIQRLAGERLRSGTSLDLSVIKEVLDDFRFVIYTNNNTIYSGFRSNEKSVLNFRPISIGFLSLPILIRAKTAVSCT